jgi:hypothetical protein
MKKQTQDGATLPSSDFLCSSIPASTAWARRNPELHRERCREASKKYRQTPKGQAQAEKRKEGRIRPDEVTCIKCGAVEKRIEAKLQDWVLPFRFGKHKGVCNSCA